MIAASFAGSIRARPVAVGREILPARSPCCAPPPWLARVSREWLERSPTAKTHWPKNGSKRPSSGSTGFGDFFNGFGAQNEFFGARVQFGTQN